MSIEDDKPKEDTVIVFLVSHRHGGVDYKKDDSAMVTAQAADKLIKGNIAIKEDKGAKATKKEGAV